MSQHSYRKFDSPLLLDIGVSGIYLKCLVVAGLLSSLAVLQLNLESSLLKLLLLAVSLSYLANAYIRHRPVTLCMNADSSWQITVSTVSCAGQLKHNCVITPFFCLLHFVLQDGTMRRVLIFRDNIQADVFRRFRVWVRVNGIDLPSHDTLTR